ncbi:tail fiber domain-containing protein [Bacteroides sp.]
METRKALFVLIILSFFYLMSYAQIKVLSNGKVGIGTPNPQYGSIEIGKSGVNNGLAIYNSSSSFPPLKFYTSGNYGYLNFGDQKKGLCIRSDGRFTIGSILTNGYGYIKNALLNICVNPENYSAALAIAANYPTNYADVIKVVSYNNTDVVFCVRDNTEGNNTSTFQVFGDGSVYAKGGYLTASDERYKENIVGIDNGLNLVKKMRGVTYTLKGQINNNSTTDKAILQKTSFSNDSIDIQSDISIEIMNKMQAEKKRRKVGFIAQELEKIFPEAVYTTTEGTKAIAYSEIIPLLVEAIKEQQKEIDELKQAKVTQTRSAIGDTDKQSDVNSLVDERLKAKLYSNIPNPFKEQTAIAFFIPETVSKASIHIYNLQGKQIKQINIEEKGNGSVVINGYELTPGMYIYTLIVDGKEIDTKKMILTE